ncbi:hypothetical protein GCM10028800_21100 [Nesterenkonia populi]
MGSTPRKPRSLPISSHGQKPQHNEAGAAARTQAGRLTYAAKRSPHGIAACETWKPGAAWVFYARTMSHHAMSPQPSVLIVEDEAPLVRLVGDYLRRDRFAVRATDDGHEALRLIRSHQPSVVVLDLGLPGLDGVEVCRQLRTFSDCYVIMLTARADEGDRLIGLSVGADDYVTKPFSPRELVLRVKAMLRRPRLAAAPPPRTHLVGPLRVNEASREIRLDSHPVEVTRTEFDLLAALIAEPGAVFSRRELINQVWGEEWVGDEHLVDVHIGNLRRKLGDQPARPRFIRTVRGVGYKLEPDRASS